MNTHPATIEEEPAREVWERLVDGSSIGEVSEDLGYSLKYGCRLAAQAASKELMAGVNYEFCANLFGEHEARCWVQIQHELDDEILAKVGHVRRIWLLTRMQMLHLAGESTASIAAALGMTETTVVRDLRTALIVFNRLRGDSLQSIATETELSRERVRQILKDSGIDKNFLSKHKAFQAGRVNETFEAIGKWILEHPGCTPAEVADTFGVSESETAAMIPNKLAHLVLDSRFKPVPGEMEARRASKLRIMQAIRHAATIHDDDAQPQQASSLYLTGPRYISLQKQGLIDGPTLPRILQLFGTWQNACVTAGVSCDEPVRQTYERRWTRGDMCRSVAEFLITEGHNGVSKYEKWAQQDVARPGFQTVRNEFGGWKAAYEEALRLLRSRWVMTSRER